MECTMEMLSTLSKECIMERRQLKNDRFSFKKTGTGRNILYQVYQRKNTPTVHGYLNISAIPSTRRTSFLTPEEKWNLDQWNHLKLDRVQNRTRLKELIQEIYTHL